LGSPIRISMKSRFRIRMKVKSRIRIRIIVKIQELWRLKMKLWMLKMEPLSAVDANYGAVEGL
jgi:hypothetical protein